LENTQNSKKEKSKFT